MDDPSPRFDRYPRDLLGIRDFKKTLDSGPLSIHRFTYVSVCLGINDLISRQIHGIPEGFFQMW